MQAEASLLDCAFTKTSCINQPKNGTKLYFGVHGWKGSSDLQAFYGRATCKSPKEGYAQVLDRLASCVEGQGMKACMKSCDKHVVCKHENL